MQTVLISGAAGGIGLATARRFCADGYRVISLDKDPISGKGLPIVSYLVDLTDDSEVERIFSLLREDQKDISHFIGIAGGASPKEPKLQTEGALPDAALFAASLDQNLVSQWRVLTHVLPFLEKAAANGETPSVTLVSSINAMAAYGLPAYSAAKAGMAGLINSMVDFLGSRGIRINALAPGTIPTPKSRAEWALAPGHFEEAGAQTALGHVGTPEAIAESLWALCLHFPHTTGEVICADGGQLKHQAG